VWIVHEWTANVSSGSSMSSCNTSIVTHGVVVPPLGNVSVPETAT